MYKFCIVDDDPNIHDELTSFISKYAEEKNYEISAVSFYDADRFLNSQEDFDLIFMDIELGESNGFTLIQELRNKGVKTIVIFISYLAQYAVDGYAVDGFDFIVKPLNYYEFSMKMKRVMKTISIRKNSTFHIQSKGDIYKIESDKLKYVEVINHTLIFHTLDKNIFVNGSLKEAREKLNNCDFVLCNQCYLVNLNYVDSINKNSVIIRGEELRISVPRKKEFEQAFLAYLKQKA